MRKRLARRLVWGGGVVLIPVLLLVLFAGGCAGPQGQQGPAGTPGSPGASTGIISGKVTNSLTSGGISGVAVTVDPAVKNLTITTDSAGAYNAELPIGVYSVTFKKTGYADVTQSMSVTAAQTLTKDITMKPSKPVAVDAGAAQSAAPDSTVKLTAKATAYDGSTISAYEWTQTAGVGAQIDNPQSDTINVRLAKSNAFKFALTEEVGKVDRVQVCGVSPFALEEANAMTFKVTVTTSSGKYTGIVAVTADMPFVVSTGIQDVPKGDAVLVQGKDQAKYAWTIAGPTDSKATLADADTRYPYFTPDVVGKYTLTETTTKTTLDVFAGTWSSGAISGQDAKGNPLSAGCTICHDGKTASNNFADWSQSGHAHIFTKNLENPTGHWSASCASCHTIGYDTAATNNGFDETMAKEGWKVPSHGEPGYFAMMLSKFPATAAQANIQCENCHGPNDGTGLHANGTYDTARITLSADLCISCHGEPPRHGRGEQWQESLHADIQLATDESGSSSCARCHTGQGFLAWLKQGDLTKSLQGAKGNATAAEMAAIVTKDNAQPITCAVCHDPHNPGSASGDPGVNTATVRIMGDTALLPSGYQAKEVGLGALCITCHNTRNGAHNDTAAPTSFSAPHAAAQGDVLMGENAYFVNTPMRSAHADLENTCVTCHMEKSPPPAEFSMNGAGTNHEFSASIEICGDCHSDAINGEAFKVGNEAKIEALGTTIAAYGLSKLPNSFSIIDTTSGSTATVISKSNVASVTLGEAHGQQGLQFTFTTGVSFSYADGSKQTLTTALARLGDITTDGKTTVFAYSDTLVKAGWNFYLIESDSSMGIHNPSFVQSVIDATNAALK